jgi:outer membrane usher protein
MLSGAGGSGLFAQVPVLSPAERAPSKIITVPLLDGTAYLGDLSVRLEKVEGGVRIPADRLSALLLPLLSREAGTSVRTVLSAADTVGEGRLANGIVLRFDPASVSLVVEIAHSLRARRDLSIAGQEGSTGNFARPAHLAAFISATGSLQLSRAPRGGDQLSGIVFLNSAARWGDFALEGDGYWQQGSRAAAFQRRGTRLIHDLPDRALRVSVGDLLTSGDGFQSSPPLAGVSLVKSYGVLQPTRITRPTGIGGFTLDRSSLVEVYVNDRLVRRLQLDPGAYDLHDFPFVEGANDVRLLLKDEVGGEEVFRFNSFIASTQLASGIDEFGVFAGVYAQPGRKGPRYSSRSAITGYYRRGLSNRLTMAVNLQGDVESIMVGTGAILSSPVGILTAQGAVSHTREGTGVAGAVGLERQINGSGVGSTSLTLQAQGTSKSFRAIGPTAPRPAYRWEVGADLAHYVSDAVTASVGLRQAVRDGPGSSVRSYRANLNWSVNPRLRIAVDAFHQVDRRAVSYSQIRIGARLALGTHASATAAYDSRSDAFRLGFQRARGTGAGSSSIFGEIERGPDGTRISADANYTGNRAVVGLSHYGNLSGGGSLSSFRIGSAIAFADGSVALGTPIRDSFAILKRHSSLAASNVNIEASSGGYPAVADRWGPALFSNIDSYVERSITIEAANAPATTDLGRGSFRILSPYHGGYRLQLGSDYSVSVVGNLLDEAGRSLAYASGEAVFKDTKDAVTVPIFTNGEGRFGAFGLRNGAWLLRMNSDPTLTYEVHVDAQANTSMAVGTLRPQEKYR